MNSKLADRIAGKTDRRKKKLQSVNEEIGEWDLEIALETIWRELSAEEFFAGQFRDENEASAAFAAAATDLLHVVDDTLSTMRQSGSATRALLDRLESRLASSDG